MVRRLTAYLLPWENAEDAAIRAGPFLSPVEGDFRHEEEVLAVAVALESIQCQLIVCNCRSLSLISALRRKKPAEAWSTCFHRPLYTQAALFCSRA